jgi:flagellin
MAQAAASSVNKEMEISMERLSTGKRLNSAADDAAGIAIASRLTAEVKGLNQAIRNAMDAVSMIETGEGALVEATNIVQRMRELAVQAANETNSTDDMAKLQLENADLQAELTRIEDSTTWAGVKLLDASGGTSGAFKYMVGTGRSGTATTDQITVTFEDLTTMSAAVSGTDISTQTGAVAQIAAADTAIGLLNAERAQLGGKVNRLESTVSNLTNISANVQAGLGRISDADFAAETTSLAKTQILQQASTAMLAQANASKQNVLSLLQG